jgi:hypothetical protein
MMPIKQAVLLAFILMSAVAYCGDIYKWVDADGKVHYGNAIPKSHKDDAMKVDVYVPVVTDKQRQEAEARAAKDKESLKPKPIPMPGPSPVSNPVASSSVQASKSGNPYTDKKLRCEEEWRKYRESLDCVAPYMNGAGALRAEAYDHCVMLKQPELCDF